MACNSNSCNNCNPRRDDEDDRDDWERPMRIYDPQVTDSFIVTINDGKAVSRILNIISILNSCFFFFVCLW